MTYQHVVTGIHFTVKDEPTEQHQQYFPTHPDFNIHIHHHISLSFFFFFFFGAPKFTCITFKYASEQRWIRELQKQGIAQTSSNTLCTFALPVAKSIHPWSHFGIIYLFSPICFLFVVVVCVFGGWGGGASYVHFTIFWGFLLPPSF